MSLMAPKTNAEAKWQYCNYGYDKSKFKSFDDCMENRDKVFNIKTELESEQAIADKNRYLQMDLAKVRFEISNASDGVQKDKLIAKENRLLAELRASSKSKLPLYIGLGIGALVIGYFAYKKFKK